ncbi:hypothetical protein GCM10027047_14720 [Rhodococcus aerolatus]
MDTTAVVFLVVGAAGLLVVLLSLVVGEIGGAISADADGPFSLPAIAALVGGVGFGGAAASTVTPAGPVGVLLDVVVGLAVAMPLAFAVIRVSAALQHMPTDPTLTRTDLHGALGVVISAVPAGGYGEVRLAVAGQQLKYHARSARPLPAGTPVYVVDTPSETSVEVVSTAPEPLPEHPTPGETP